MRVLIIFHAAGTSRLISTQENGLPGRRFSMHCSSSLRRTPASLGQIRSAYTSIPWPTRMVTSIRAPRTACGAPTCMQHQRGVGSQESEYAVVTSCAIHHMQAEGRELSGCRSQPQLQWIQLVAAVHMPVQHIRRPVAVQRARNQGRFSFPEGTAVAPPSRCRDRLSQLCVCSTHAKCMTRSLTAFAACTGNGSCGRLDTLGRLRRCQMGTT